MTVKAKIFYVLIVTVLMGKVALTLLERSGTMYHGHQVVALQNQIGALVEQKQILTQQLAQQSALTDISRNLDQHKFAAITQLIVISSPKQLASTD